MQRKKNDDVVYVCLSTNDKWAPFAAATIASILSNTKSKVHFFVLYTELSQENIDIINALLEKSLNKTSAETPKNSNASIDYISVNDGQLQNFNSNIPYITNDTFSKILFPNIKNDIERVIYTDVDVVFKGDVAELFNEDLSGHVIGAVEGISHSDGKDNIRLNIDKNHKYFQAGLLLIDCKKWREEKITSACFRILRGNQKLRYGDQDLLNIVFSDNNYKKLHQKYCVIPFQLAETQSFSEDSREALRKPFIIHYAGGNKPWITSGPLENDFWRYAAMTDFFPDIIKMRLNSDFVSKERSITTKQYKLFGIIPLLKIKRKFMYFQITERYFLFNFVPILKKVDDFDSVTWTSFFGAPILRLTKSKNER